MGLDTSHDCWHGAYSAFMRWREKIAEVAGFPPLWAMEGFFDPGEWAMYRRGERIDLVAAAEIGAMDTGTWLMSGPASVVRSLPIRWTRYETDPLWILLSHSDCDGIIEAKDCGPIARRLEEILPAIPEGDGGGHIGDWRAKTQAFIDGLRSAEAAGENVEFH